MTIEMNSHKHKKANSILWSLPLIYKALLGYVAYFVFYPSILASIMQYLRGVKFEKILSNYIGFQVLIDSNFPELVEIREGAWLTRGVVILTHFNPTPYLTNIIGPMQKKKVIIGRGVFVGVNSIILPGVEIGEGSIIGAGSVVTENVPPFSFVAGNPARVIRYINNQDWN